MENCILHQKPPPLSHKLLFWIFVYDYFLTKYSLLDVFYYSLVRMFHRYLLSLDPENVLPYF